MKKSLTILYCTVFVLIAISLTNCKKGHPITGTKGVVKEILNGNTIKLTSGLKVQLLGISPDHESCRVYMENNNIVGKKVSLIADKGAKKQIYKKSSETVKAYVFLLPENICLNGMILRQFVKADNTVYSEAHMTDSVNNWRSLIADGCNHAGVIPDIALFMKQRTFLIATPDGIGTGFFINKNGLALTNGHVLPKSRETSARIYMYADNADDSKLYTEKERNVRKILYYS